MMQAATDVNGGIMALVICWFSQDLKNNTPHRNDGLVIELFYSYQVNQDMYEMDYAYVLQYLA